MHPSKRIIPRIAAVAEILIVLIVGSILYKVILTAIFSDDFLLVQFSQEKSNALAAAITESARILLHFSVVLAIAFLLMRFVHRVKTTEVGLTRNKHSIFYLVCYGIVLFSFSAFPWKAIVLINQLIPLGEGMHGWDDINQSDWSLPVLLLIAARAAILPPLMEEPLARGYMFHRLQLVYGAAGAMILSAVMFTFSHGHFSSSDPVILVQLFCTLVSTACWAFATWQTGSIIPAIVAHGLFNSPEPENSLAMGGIVTMMAIVIISCQSKIRSLCTVALHQWSLTHHKTEVMLTGVGLAGVMALGAVYKILIVAVLGLSVLIVIINILGQRYMKVKPSSG